MLLLALRSSWLALAVTLSSLLAAGCDASAEFCLGSTEVTVDHFVMCDKSCLKGNQASCAREQEIATHLCHDKNSVYHCIRACSAGDVLACGKAKAAMR
jgi:hypothetical protein